MGPTRRRWLLPAVGLIAGLTAAGCGASDEPAQSSTEPPTAPSTTPPSEPEAPVLDHVHDLALAQDGTLYAATHVGLFRIGAGEAVAVGEDGLHDLMAFAIEPDGTLVASGHPDLRTDILRAEGSPPLLGLVESTDGGSNWSGRSLLGEADFHTLVVTDDGFLGADGTSGRLLVSADGVEWEERGELNGLDLAVDPADGDRMIAATYDGDTVWSVDGGFTWEPLDTPEFVAVEWPEPGRLVAAGVDGVIYTTTRPDGPWEELSRLDAEPEALLATESDTMWVATRRGGLHESADGGQTWNVVLVATQD